MIEKETVSIHFHSEMFDFLVLLMADLPGRMLQGIEIHVPHRAGSSSRRRPSTPFQSHFRTLAKLFQ